MLQEFNPPLTASHFYFYLKVPDRVGSKDERLGLHSVVPGRSHDLPVIISANQILRRLIMATRPTRGIVW